ncbi:endonuclease/exonuclease/phosphatase family protein [Catellatospora coxensis]
MDTARRRPLLLAALQAADADVIALQEVEPALLALLRDAPWVRAAYTLNAAPDAAAPGGLVLLSRLPVREAGSHRLAPHKAAVAIVVDTAAGPLAIAATHLSSDHSADGARRRQDELTRLAEGLADIAADLVLLGDFNDDGAAPTAMLGMDDAWTLAYGTADRTPTFDPVANPSPRCHRCPACPGGWTGSCCAAAPRSPARRWSATGRNPTGCSRRTTTASRWT